MPTAAPAKAGSDTSLPVETKRVAPDVIRLAKRGHNQLQVQILPHLPISPSSVLYRALVTNMNRLTTNQSWKVYNYD